MDEADTSDGARAAPASLDAFLYIARGVYRTGETLHVTVFILKSPDRSGFFPSHLQHPNHVGGIRFELLHGAGTIFGSIRVASNKLGAEPKLRRGILTWIKA